jgi:hypothetical protein
MTAVLRTSQNRSNLRVEAAGLLDASSLFPLASGPFPSRTEEL